MKIMLDKIREVELTETDSIDDIISETFGSILVCLISSYTME